MTILIGSVESKIDLLVEGYGSLDARVRRLETHLLRQ